MARLTTAQRNALPDSAFAGPNRTYPISVPGDHGSHARNALSRASQFAGPALKARISAKVHAKYKNMGKPGARHAAMKSLRHGSM